MKVDKLRLGWTNKCCGCLEIIKPNNTTIILSEIVGIGGSIHLCDKCVEKVVSVIKQWAI